MKKKAEEKKGRKSQIAVTRSSDGFTSSSERKDVPEIPKRADKQTRIYIKMSTWRMLTSGVHTADTRLYIATRLRAIRPSYTSVQICLCPHVCVNRVPAVDIGVYIYEYEYNYTLQRKAVESSYFLSFSFRFALERDDLSTKREKKFTWSILT